MSDSSQSAAHYIKFIMTGIPAGYTVLSTTSIITAKTEWTVDWGDGSETEELSRFDTSLPYHKYRKAGNYTITLEGEITGISAVSAEECPIITNSRIGNPYLTKIELDNSSPLFHYGAHTFRLCGSLTSVKCADGSVSPAEFGTIRESAFEECYRLKKVYGLGQSLSIGDKAFSQCFALEGTDSSHLRVELPRTTSIGASAFEQCVRLKEFAFSSSLETVGVAAFRSCARLSSISFIGAKPDIGASAFAGVPASCVISAFPSAPSWISLIGQKWNGLHVTALSDYSLLYDYKDDGEGGVTLTKYKGEEPDVQTPTAIDGKPVRSVACFVNCKNVKTITISEGVRRLVNNAISFCSDLLRVSLPSTLTELGHYHCWGCENLVSVHSPGGSSLPSGLTEVPNGMFQGCANLASLIIPSSVKKIGDCAFQGCSKLASVSLPSELEDIGEYAFRGCDRIGLIEIPSTVTSIGAGAFSGCGNLARVNFLGDAPVECGESAFGGGTHAIGYVEVKSTGWGIDIPGKWNELPLRYDWSKEYLYYALDSQSMAIAKYLGTDAAIAIPAQIDGLAVTRVSERAFYGNPTLVSVAIPSSVRDIGPSAFRNCTALDTVVFEGDAPYAMEGTFSGCAEGCKAVVREDSSGWGSVPGKWRGLNIQYDYDILFSYHSDENGNVVIDSYNGNASRITVPSSINGKPVTEIAEGAFRRNLFLSDCTLSQNLVKIGVYAFYECSRLRSVALPATLGEIGAAAFGYTSLGRVKIPEGVTEIKENTFSECSRLGYVALPETLVEIGDNAFCNCKELRNVRGGNSVTAFGGSAFEGCESLKTFTMPHGVTLLGSACFAQCATLEEIAIPLGISTIPSHCFFGCGNLERVELPHEYNVGYGAFSGCGALKEFLPPDTHSFDIQADIGSYAFYGCSSLRRVGVAASVAEIGDCCFSGCSSLEYLTFGDAEPSVGLEAFSGVPISCIAYVAGSVSNWNTDDGRWHGILMESDLSDKYRWSRIGDEIRIDEYLDSQVDGISLPDKIMGLPVTIIGEGAFTNGPAITIAHFPSRLKEIDDRAFFGVFRGCTTPFPETLVRIGDEAFLQTAEGGYGPIALTFEGDAPACGYNAFAGQPGGGYSATVHEGTIGWITEREEVPYPYSGAWHKVAITSAPRPS